MNRSKFEYFLNAVLYCLWLRENKREYICGRIVETILSPIPKLFFTKKYKKKYYEQYLPEADAKSDELFHDKKTDSTLVGQNTGSDISITVIRVLSRSVLWG